MVRRPRLLSWRREEVFCEFLLGGARFEIWEPYGDNSRYWIGPAGANAADMRPTEEIARVREAFISAGALTAFLGAFGARERPGPSP